MPLIDLRKSNLRKIKSEESEENSQTTLSLKLLKESIHQKPNKFQNKLKRKSEIFSAKFSKFKKLQKFQSMIFLQLFNQKPFSKDLHTERETETMPKTSLESKELKANWNTMKMHKDKLMI